MSSAWPEPTPAELATLTFHSTSWGSRTRVQQAIRLAILRGHTHVPAIAHSLHLSKTQVEAALVDLIGSGPLWDNHTLLFH